jgi:hypothetical protein
MTPDQSTTDGEVETSDGSATARIQSWNHGGLYVAAAVGLTAALWVGGGLAGVALALFVIGLWTVIPTAYAFAVGQLLYAVFVADPEPAGVVGAAAFGLLLVVDLIEQWPQRVAKRATIVFLIATGAFVAIWSVTESLERFALIAIGFTLASYGMYRYGLVRLGLVSEPAS